jgi:hypothetical protein
VLPLFKNSYIHVAADCCSQRDTVLVMFNVLPHSTFTVQMVQSEIELYLTVITQKLLLHVQLHNSTAHLLYKYCTNCTVCNWTILTVITQKLLLLHVQLHSTFTVQILYSLQLSCTYSNYTEASAKCSAAQEHNTFSVQILYSLQLNCTYSNYTEAVAAACSAAQQHSTFTVQILYKLYSLQLNCT